MLQREERPYCPGSYVYETHFSHRRGYLAPPRVEITHGLRGKINYVWLWLPDPVEKTRHPVGWIPAFVSFHGPTRCWLNWRATAAGPSDADRETDNLHPELARELYKIARAVVTKREPVEGLLDRLQDHWPELGPTIAEIIT